ncbi:hypothetical protein [Ornithinibacillus scapharcae]|uniref:hypothetical protein n=1 Tax=Ornithinibacillus scapharcae TaxID=1147159 RepID=UPI000225BA0F|nr:hypothetical protein [Ornithinibacillus scapharcae]
MGLAVVKEHEADGVFREEFESGLLQIGDMARIAEQRLTLKADHSIQELYFKQKQAIEDMIIKIQLLKSYK